MKILTLETSTKQFSLAVSSGGKVLAHRNVRLKKVLSSSIIPAIDQMLTRLKMTLKDLDGFAIGLGPGSFTSLRVGLSTVKAFALATGKPVVGIPSLDALARNGIDQPCDQICTIVDARRNMVYAAVYEKKGDGLKRISDYMLTGLDKVLDKVTGKTLYVGDGVALYRGINVKKYNEAAKKHKTSCKSLFAEEKFWYPQASELARIAHERFERSPERSSKDFDPIEKLVPLYLYPEDCQVNRPASGAVNKELIRDVR